MAGGSPVDRVPDETPRSKKCEFLAQLGAQCLPHIDRFTVAMYGLQDNAIKQDRTGVLYCIGDDYFVLTASHDLREIVEHGIPLFIQQSNAPNSAPIPLVDAVFHGTEVDRGRDVAAISVTRDIAEQLQVSRGFLRHDRVAMEDDGHGLYVLFGYPMAWMGRGPQGGIASRPLIYTARCHRGQMSPEAHHDPRVHIALEFERDAVDALEHRRETLPNIHGMSGCGVWRVADWTARSLSRWSARDLRLVALQHRWGKEARYVRGTWVRFALQLILDNYPDLRRAMNLVYPPSDEI